MDESRYTCQPIGVVRSALTSLEAAPLQGDEGAPEAWLELRAPLARGLVGIAAGDELVVLTWLHRARRDVLQVHPRGRLEAPLTGVFATGRADRGDRWNTDRRHQARAPVSRRAMMGLQFEIEARQSREEGID